MNLVCKNNQACGFLMRYFYKIPIWFFKIDPVHIDPFNTELHQHGPFCKVYINIFLKTLQSTSNRIDTAINKICSVASLQMWTLLRSIPNTWDVIYIFFLLNTRKYKAAFKQNPYLHLKVCILSVKSWLRKDFTAIYHTYKNSFYL